MLQIACDGSCLGNPGPGGWAAVFLSDAGEETVLSGGDPHTTNNRMELTAAIRAVEAVPAGTPATVLSDSEYVVRGITEWVPRWIRRRWQTTARRPVKNADLWQRLVSARSRRPEVRFQWVRGHAGHPGNERAHDLASAEAARHSPSAGFPEGPPVPGSG